MTFMALLLTKAFSSEVRVTRTPQHDALSILVLNRNDKVLEFIISQ